MSLSQEGYGEKRRSFVSRVTWVEAYRLSGIRAAGCDPETLRLRGHATSLCSGTVLSFTIEWEESDVFYGIKILNSKKRHSLVDGPIDEQ